MSLGEKPKKSRAPIIGLLLIAMMCGVGFAWWSASKHGGEPQINIQAPDAVGKRGAFVVTVQEPIRGVIDVVVEVAGAGVEAKTVGEVHNPMPQNAFAAAAPTEAVIKGEIGKDVMPSLVEGTLKIKVTATRASSWLRSFEPVVLEKSIAVRLTPPTVTPMSSFVHVAQGGSEVIVYEVGAGAKRDGVVVARKEEGQPPWEFRGFPLPGGSPTSRFAFFSLPYDDDGAEVDVKARVLLFAEDGLGNRSTAAFVHKVIPRPMGTDTIELKDPFLAKVTGEIFPQTPALQRTGDLLADYLTLNRDLRATNNAFLVDLAQKTTQKFLWSTTFQPFGDAAIKGAFADRRSYTRDGKKVDSQDHLGFDLARVERAPINSGNDGVVVMAAYFGIYGNCVVVDHGYGLMTLYAHLSTIQVKEGDEVKRGQTLGLTGATGLAGGDHLHFTTLIGGRPVNPIEWWDGHWIQDRVKLKLGESFMFVDAKKK